MNTDKIQRMNALLEQAEKQILTIQKIVEELQESDKVVQELSDYYTSDDYMTDIDEFLESKEPLKTEPIFSEDRPWNAINDYYEEKINLMKQLVNSL